MRRFAALAIGIFLLPSSGYPFLSLKGGGYIGTGEMLDAPIVGVEYGQSVNGIIPSGSVFYIQQYFPSGSLPRGKITLVPAIFSLYSDIRVKEFSIHAGGGVGFGFVDYKMGWEQELINSLGVEDVKVDLEDAPIFTARVGVERKYPGVSVGIEFFYMWMSARFTTVRINRYIFERHFQEGYVDLGGILGSIFVKF